MGPLSDLWWVPGYLTLVSMIITMGNISTNQSEKQTSIVLYLSYDIIIGEHSTLPLDYCPTYGRSPGCLTMVSRVLTIGNISSNQSDIQANTIMYFSHYIIVKLMSENVVRPHGTSVRPMVGTLGVSPWCLGFLTMEIFQIFISYCRIFVS